MTSKTKTIAMIDEAAPALEPKLRFPDFRDAGGWNMTPLGELGAIVTGKTPSTKEDDLWGGEILFITPTDITEDEKYQHTTQRKVVETTGTKVLPPGSVVYTCIASIGKMALTVVPSVTNQQINAVLPNGKTAREFIYYSLANLTPWIKSIPATSTLPIINKSQFSQFIIPHPEDKQEQQKIAECLSSVDDLIAAQGQKVDALKTHKKGLMQQLFPREGETQPRLRFPEFQNAGEWQIKELGKLCKIRTGKKDANEGAEDGIYPFFTCAEKHIYSHSYSFDAEAILVAGNANVGQAKYYNGKFEAYQRTYVLTDFSGINVPFLFTVLDSNLRPSLMRQVQSSAMSYIKLPMLQEFEVAFPTNSDEQIAIASCLTTIDDLISTESQKLESLKTHKAGLMQQLFPSTEEVDV